MPTDPEDALRDTRSKPQGRLRVDVPVVDPFDQRPLERKSSVLRLEVLRARVVERVERIAPVDRDQLVAKGVVRGVKRHREVDR